MAVRTTVIGSWWPYPEDETDLARYHAGKLSATEGEAVLKRAATRAIAEQRSLGLTEWTGGEYHTDNFIMHMHDCLTGVEVDKPQAEDPFDYDDLAVGGNPYSPRWRCRYRGVRGQIVQPMERARRVQAIAKEHVVGGRHCR